MADELIKSEPKADDKIPVGPCIKCRELARIDPKETGILRHALEHSTNNPAHMVDPKKPDKMCKGSGMLIVNSSIRFITVAEMIAEEARQKALTLTDFAPRVFA
jgi:hypothetical protein